MRDDEDFADYVRASGNRLLRLAYLQTGSAVTAQDVVQTVLGRPCRPIPRRYRPGCSSIDGQPAQVTTVGGNEGLTWEQRIRD